MYFFRLVATLFLLGCVHINSQAQNIQPIEHDSLPYNYLVHLPEGYDSTDQQYPILFYLHGRSIMGNDLEKVKRYGVIYEIIRGLEIDFVVIAPQCQSGWNTDRLNELLDHSLATYRIDSCKTYLTGMSMGGYGAWFWAGASPERFAAVAPVCGGGKTKDAPNMKDLPTWVFHGKKDRAVPISESQKMVDALEEAGNEQVDFTIYKEYGHSELIRVFRMEELYEWFLEYEIP